MDRKSSTTNRKSAVRVNDALAALNAETQYLTPIFGTAASGASMPNKRINKDPVEPQVALEMIREYLKVEGNATQNLATLSS